MFRQREYSLKGNFITKIRTENVGNIVDLDSEESAKSGRPIQNRYTVIIL